MPLTHLIIKNLRNIDTCDITLSTGFNFFVGQNGSGKTSLLESIYILGHGRSFKTKITNRIVQYESPELFIHAKFIRQLEYSADKIEIPIGISKHKDGSSIIKINGQTGVKQSDLAQILPLQLIHPEGFALLTEGPKYRRAFINWGVFHTNDTFFDAWSMFKRLLKQRNALLKTTTNYKQFTYWDHKLGILATQIDEMRQKYIERLSSKAKNICQEFLPEFQISLQYYRGWDKASSYAQVLEQNFERDRKLGHTLSSPNNANLNIKINNIPVEDVLSRGQLKLLVCALKIAQGQDVAETTNKSCIYLIDDFTSELDHQRQIKLATYLQEIKAQVFISAVNMTQISNIQNTNNSNIFYVDCGKIMPLDIMS